MFTLKNEKLFFAKWLAKSLVEMSKWNYCNNRVDVCGRKYVFGPTQAHFSFVIFEIFYDCNRGSPRNAQKGLLRAPAP